MSAIAIAMRDSVTVSMSDEMTGIERRSASLNAVNVTFVAFSKALNDVSGQAIVFFVLVVAAAEVAVGLAIIVAIFRRRRSGATADDVDLLQG